MLIHFKRFGQGGSKYFTNPNPEDAELQEALNSMKLSRQKDSMKQIIASMTIGKDVSKLFPDVVKLIRTKRCRQINSYKEHRIKKISLSLFNKLC